MKVLEIVKKQTNTKQVGGVKVRERERRQKEKVKRKKEQLKPFDVTLVGSKV